MIAAMTGARRILFGSALGVLAGIGGAGTAWAQTIYFADDFACSDEQSFGDPPGIYGWEATSPDAWRTDVNGGVSPDTDDGIGSFGPPADDFENFLLTGHSAWRDVVIEADFTNTDDDSFGFVIRYTDLGTYYACYMTKHQGPTCGGTADVGDRVALIRVDTTQACANDYMVQTITSFAYTGGTTYRMRMSAIGDTITCTIDADADGTLGSGGDLDLSYVDPDPIPSGLAGLYSFDNGEPDGGMLVDDVVITGFDPDADGDGIPNDVETALGTDPNDADSDNDGISDGHEAGMPQHPPDADSDRDTDAVDDDADGDGIPDLLEAGDFDPATPPVDTDCDGLPDYRDDDSDGDGIGDDVDNCRLTPGPQDDGDGDLVGDVCDADPDDPSVCADTDGDGCDDCISGSFDPDNDDADPSPNCEPVSAGDSDGDGVGDVADNCIDVPNEDQEDLDGDDIGDACDRDADNDGFDDDLTVGGAGIACRGAAPGSSGVDLAACAAMLVVGACLLTRILRRRRRRG